VVEIPVSVAEVVCGASISVPTLDEPISLKIPAGSQSGTELRVRERGIPHKDGSRGDIFYRLLIKVPEATSALGLAEKAKELDPYYGTSLRQHLTRGLLE
jgi:molecular chaperone DnaJ